MNASKILSIICFSFFTAVALAKITYNPNQLQQFEKTNQCVNCDLSNAYLVYENHSQANLDKTNLSGTEASRIDLSGATLTNTNLTSVDFYSANLSGANFSGSVLYGSVLDFADLYGANITSQQLAETSSICEAILPDGSESQCKYSEKK